MRAKETTTGVCVWDIRIYGLGSLWAVSGLLLGWLSVAFGLGWAGLLLGTECITELNWTEPSRAELDWTELNWTELCVERKVVELRRQWRTFTTKDGAGVVSALGHGQHKSKSRFYAKKQKPLPQPVLTSQRLLHNPILYHSRLLVTSLISVVAQFKLSLTVLRPQS